MTEPSAAFPPRPPAALLDLLRRLEGRLDESDPLRGEVHAVRQALESDEAEDAVISPATVHAIVSIADGGHLRLSGSGGLELSGSPAEGTVTGGYHYEGEAHGEAPPEIENQPTRDWLNTLKRRGGQSAKVADFVTRLIYIAVRIIGESF